MREQDIQNAVMVALSRNGHRVWRSNAGMALSPSILNDPERKPDRHWIKLLPNGFPDLFGYNGQTGQFFAIEMKTATGRLRPDQIKFAEFIKNQPVRYGVARSVDDALKIVEGGER